MEKLRGGRTVPSQKKVVRTKGVEPLSPAGFTRHLVPYIRIMGSGDLNRWTICVSNRGQWTSHQYRHSAKNSPTDLNDWWSYSPITKGTRSWSNIKTDDLSHKSESRALIRPDTPLCKLSQPLVHPSTVRFSSGSTPSGLSLYSCKQIHNEPLRHSGFVHPSNPLRSFFPLSTLTPPSCQPCPITNQPTNHTTSPPTPSIF